MKPVDLSGQKFGKLTAIERCGSQNGDAVWRCMCECGGEKIAKVGNLKVGHTRSCGCLVAESAKERPPHKHGYGRRNFLSPTYTTWEAMRSRCNNPNSDWYHRYGGRGIKVCERWNDFSSFLADMGERPKGKTLDRINPDGNYESSNCRWSTPKEQSNNRSKL